MTETETVPTFRERVEAGAQYLDGVLPGWWERIDLAHLDLRNGCRCVLGQLAHDVAPKSDEFEFDFLCWVEGDVPGVPEIGLEAAVTMGFTETTDTIGFDVLEDEWRRLITERRAS